ncbi:peptide/nickel transport system substrate-binding protein [Rhizobium sp. BK313]|uniref:ABC transporter substrate-binding protein n=1 Tax=Rhizobium sp. BK313 TaxID=2587081 RepID=UPI00105E6696|nr:ABC transporter substrate-binding protein [Rhizobium sp. BK313]MBB3456374.1 peptide/nickel transport system substrate-binding protein [Rhizobium sp. BK313]
MIDDTGLRPRVRSFALALASSLLISTSAFAQTYSEAPALDAQVTAGTLPPVQARLPKNPLVVQPTESVGQYGGTWRMAMIGSSDSMLDRTIGYTRLVRWDPAWTKIVPDLAESVTENNNATEFVFKLREGTKWSDGTPFTADNILFWYNDILMNKDITPAVPSWLVSGGQPVKVVKRGDYEVAFIFAAPNGLFLPTMATIAGSDIIAGSAEQYLKQFHKKYNPDGVAALAKAQGAADWVQLITNKIIQPNRWRDAKRPVLDPWKLDTPYSGTSQVVAARNPYYYKVDPAGHQLPYIDKVALDVVQDPQAVVLKAINGQIDMQTQYLDSVDVRPVIVQNQQQGDYKLFISQPAWSNAMLINLNQTDKNPTLRKAFSNKDFRIGLSYAINRDELNQLIYAGVAQPYQGSPRPNTVLYDDGMAHQYTEYSVDRANQHLDAAGLTKKDAQGFRLDSEGNRISFPIDVLTTMPLQIDALERIKVYWAAVGIDMQVRPVEQSLAFARLQSNDEDALVWIGGGGYDLLGLLDPKWYVPFSKESSYATAWGLYYQNPSDPHAEEPPAIIKKQQDLYRQVQTASSLKEQMELMKQVLAITKDQFYIIGTNMDPDKVGVVKNNMHNVPASMPNTFFYVTPGPTNPEQYYFSQN